MYVIDQKARENLIKYFNKELDTTIISFKEIEREVLAADSVNYIELNAIMEEYGFPGYNLVGKDYSNSFWNLVQHQDYNVEFQEFALQKMKIEVDKNNATKAYYAYLVDRVKVNKGEKQVYGSQMQLNKDSSSYEPQPVIHPKKLNKRRKEMDLPPIEEYIKTMNERYFGTLKNEK